MSAQSALLTADELPPISLRLSSEGKRSQLVEGELIVTALAGARHGSVANTVADFLGQHTRGGPGGTVFAAGTGFVVGRDPDTVLAPDVSFVSSKRLSHDEIPSGFLELAPDLAVEVASPGESATAVLRKAELWLQAGATVVWNVFPQTRTVVVYRAVGEAETLTESDTLTGAPVLTDFTVPVSDLFA